MGFKDFFDEKTSASSMRLNFFMIILAAIANAVIIMVVAIIMSYQSPKIENGMIIPTTAEKAMNALLWSEGILLGAGTGGKVGQKILEGKNGFKSDVPPDGN